MPDTALNNVQPIRFEAGGVFRITDGATDYALRNREKGTLRMNLNIFGRDTSVELEFSQVRAKQ